MSAMRVRAWAFILGAVCLWAPGAQAFDASHALYAGVLAKHVSNERVAYEALKADSSELDAYLDELAAVSEADFQSWPADEQIAFLINVYNASTLRLVIDRYPLKSIKDIGTLLKGPWDQPAVRLFGESTTLDTVEHEILRKKYTEPRVHFALVCAAKGCPPLRGEPYVAARLEEQFEDQGRRFLASGEKNAISAGERTVGLSPIFKWFKDDFLKKSPSVLGFVQPYFPAGSPQDLASGGYKIKYTPYDWSLNDAKG